MTKKGNNPRKGRVIYNLWLKPEEEELIKEILGKRVKYESDGLLLLETLREIKSRRDLEKR